MYVLIKRQGVLYQVQSRVGEGLECPWVGKAIANVETCVQYKDYQQALYLAKLLGLLDSSVVYLVEEIVNLFDYPSS